MKHIEESVLRTFFNDLEASTLLYGEVILRKSMIKVYCSDSGILTNTLLSFIHEFCISNNMLYYVNSSVVDGRVYVVLHRKSYE